MKVVIDTSVYIDFFRTGKGLYPLAARGGAASSLYTPTIVVLELYAGMSASNIKIARQIKRVIGSTKVIELTKQLAQQAGDLLRKGSVVEPEDAVIAATALYLGAELATLNQKHFSKVKGLKIFKIQKG